MSSNLERIKFDNTETGSSVGQKINKIMDHVDSELTYASQTEADAGAISNKIISPKTLKNSLTNELSGVMKQSAYDTNNNGIVDNAEKVNNLTVETAVPSNAVFTDTTYTAGQGLTLTGTEFKVSASLNEISDVNLTSISNDQILKYDGAKWVNSTLPSAPVTSVNTKTGDVVLTTDDVSAGNNKYYSSALFSADFNNKSINDLKNVNVSSLSSGQILEFDGTNWVNKVPASAPVNSVNGKTGTVVLDLNDINDVDTSGVKDNSIMSYSAADSKWKTTQITDSDEKVKVSANDTTPAYLSDKVTSGNGISIVTKSSGANENLNLSAQTWVEDINGNNIPCFSDAKRSKILSLETNYLLFSEAAVNTAEWFSISNASDDESSYIAEFDGTIVGISGYCVKANPSDVDLFINTTKSGSIAKFTQTGAAESINDQTLDIDVSQGDRIRIQNNGGTLTNVNLSLRIKWRKA